METNCLNLLDDLITNVSAYTPALTPTTNDWAHNLSVQQIFEYFPHRFWEIFAIRSKYKSFIAPYRPITVKEAVELITNLRGLKSKVDAMDNGVRGIIGSTIYELHERFMAANNADISLLYEIAAILGIHQKDVKQVFAGIKIINIPNEIINNENEQFLQDLHDKVLQKYMTIFKMEMFDGKNESVKTKEIWITISCIFTRSMFNRLQQPLAKYFAKGFNKPLKCLIKAFDKASWKTNYMQKLAEQTSLQQKNLKLKQLTTATSFDEKQLEEDDGVEEEQKNVIDDVEFDLYGLNFRLYCKPGSDGYGLWIDSIADNAPLYVQDHLKVGVQILSINGTDITCMQFPAAMELWKGSVPLKIKYRPLNHVNYVSREAHNNSDNDIPKNAKYHLFKVFGLISMTFYCMAIGSYLDYEYKLMHGNYSYGFYMATVGLIYYIWTSLNKKKHILFIILIPIIYGIVQGITIKYTLSYMYGGGNSKKTGGNFSENNDREKHDAEQFCWGIIWIAMFFTWYTFLPFVTSVQFLMHLGALVSQLIMSTILGYSMKWWVNILFSVIFTGSMVTPISRLLSPATLFNDEKYPHLDYVIDATNFVADIVAQTMEYATRR